MQNILAICISDYLMRKLKPVEKVLRLKWHDKILSVALKICHHDISVKQILTG